MIFNKYPYTDFHEMNLDWIIKKMQELITAWAATREDWENTREEFTELKDWIDNYFDNLDVQVEINNKLDAMYLSGELSTLISPFVASGLPAVVADQIGAVVAAQISAVVASQLPSEMALQLPPLVASEAASQIGTWLSSHIDPDTGYVIDNTLTTALAAADARVTGDFIRSFKDGSGFLPDTIQADDMKIFDRSINLLNMDDLVSGYIYAYNAIQASTAYKTTGFIPVEEGDVLKIGYLLSGTIYDNQAFFTWFTYDENGNGVSHYNTNNDHSITIPAGAKYVRAALNNAYFSAKVMIYKNAASMSAYVPFELSLKEEYMKYIKDGSVYMPQTIDENVLKIYDFSDNLLDTATLENGYLSNYNVITAGAYKTTQYITAEVGDVFKVGYDLNGTISDNQAFFTWYAYDEFGNMTEHYTNTNEHSITIANARTKYIRVSLNNVYFSANVMIYKNAALMSAYVPFKQVIKTKFLPAATFGNIITVGADGQYQTIVEAVAACTSDDVIVLLPGTYTERISSTKAFTLIGTDREKCIIAAPGSNYDDTPLFISGNVTISNITVQMDFNAPDPVRNGYAVHVDRAGAGTIRFENCKFYNNVGAVLGAGGNQDQIAIYDNCEFTCDVPATLGQPDAGYSGYGCVFYHAPTSAGVTGCKAIFKDCLFKSTLDRVFTLSSIQDASNMDIDFINNVAYSDTHGHTNVVVWNASTYLHVGDISYGNSTSELN